jgi:hypothetical protein
MRPLFPHAWMIAGVVFASACASPEWKSDPEVATVDNEFLTVSIRPVCHEWIGCNSFVLRIVNKTEKDIEVNWNRTLYIRNGQTSGGFMFEGVIFADRNNNKPPDVIFKQVPFTKVIWPSNLVTLDRSPTGWRHIGMPNGRNGLYLTVVVSGKEINQRVELTIYGPPVPTGEIPSSPIVPPSM